LQTIQRLVGTLGVINLELNEVSVVYFDCNQPHISCAFEGALIYKLMPLANDDTYKILLK
tara:strand:+ start:254 stop:433 length:180 start_codon:yes stop_codon:yes gene_type:complete